MSVLRSALVIYALHGHGSILEEVGHSGKGDRGRSGSGIARSYPECRGRCISERLRPSQVSLNQRMASRGARFGAGSYSWDWFVNDSPQEGDGFELLVPPRRNSPRAPGGLRARLHQLGEEPIPRGAKSSIPASSSGESVEGSRLAGDAVAGA